MTTFGRLADLPLEIERAALRGLRAEVSSGFTRLSTVLHLHGGGHEGVGEDVVYDEQDHRSPAGWPTTRRCASSSTRRPSGRPS